MVAEYRLDVSKLGCGRQNRILFSDLSFRLGPGDALLIEGANGSGKSSLLRLLCGLATPDTGEIYWRNQSIQQIYSEYCDNLHYMSHQNGIKLGLTVMENINLSAYLNADGKIMETDIEFVLSQLQLNAYRHSPAKNLSAGQKRRIALARLFLLPKKLWILDEPLTALDTQTQSVFLSRLESHLQNGGIAVISSHHTLDLKNDLKVQTLRLEQSC
jgi:heme exporter protein A